MSGFLFHVTGRTLLMSPKERNASRGGLVKIGWVVYSLLFSCTHDLGKFLMPFCACMMRNQLGARLYIGMPFFRVR